MTAERVAILVLLSVNGLCLWLLEPRVSAPASPSPEGKRRLGANVVLTVLLLALNVAFDRVAAMAGIGPRGDALALPGASVLPGWTKVLAIVVVLDGLGYLAHLLLHKLPPAWRFHRVHHSDPRVDVTTAFRQHPFETLWRYSFTWVGAVALGASSRSVAVYLALSALNAQLEHADVTLPRRLEGVLRLVFTTPAMHRVHHSRAQVETDTNYSNIFSVWDRLFGTYRAPRTGERLSLGLDGYDSVGQQRTAGLLALPFGR